IAIDEAANRIYIGQDSSQEIAVIDGATQHVNYVAAGSHVWSLAVNSANGDVTVGTADGLFVMQPRRRYPIPLATTIAPLPNDVSRGDAPSLMLVASNDSLYSTTPPRPSDVYFQLDTQLGPWIPAAPGATDGTWIADLGDLALGSHMLYAY